LCRRFVNRVARADRRGRLRFAPLQGETARALLPSPLVERPATVVLLDERGLSVRSTAVLRILGELGWPWRAAASLWLVPRPWRDAAYDLVARHRGRLGAGRPAAPPDAEQRARFLP
jgi:predicted DCC family thiol-disulfide oxidoreductase YuxK